MTLSFASVRIYVSSIKACIWLICFQSCSGICQKVECFCLSELENVSNNFLFLYYLCGGANDNPMEWKSNRKNLDDSRVFEFVHV